MAINLITGYDLGGTPMQYLGWGNSISYEKDVYQNGNVIELLDIDK